MSRIANEPAPAREYRSELRAQHAEDTRSRILDAALRVMANGFASVSVPNVAREAGVSVPTIYRHFGTKQELLDAIYPHLARSSAQRVPEPPATVDDIRQGVIQYIGYLDTLDDLARAALASPAADPFRKQSIGRRLEVFRPAVDAIEPPLAKADRERIIRLIAVLTSSGTVRLLHDHLEASPDDVADDIDWFIRAAVAAARPKASR